MIKVEINKQVGLSKIEVAGDFKDILEETRRYVYEIVKSIPSKDKRRSVLIGGIHDAMIRAEHDMDLDKKPGDLLKILKIMAKAAEEDEAESEND